MGTIQKPSNFQLCSLEALKNTGLAVEWNDNGDVLKRKSALPPHPDLKPKLTYLEGALADYYGIKDHQAVHLKKLTVTEYEDGEGVSVQITGVHTHPKSGQNTPLKTAKMPLHNDHYGFEAELKGIVEKIALEACAYVFERKSSQLSLDDKAA